MRLLQAGLVPKEKAEKISKQIDSRKVPLAQELRERYEFLEKQLASTRDLVKGWFRSKLR